MTNKKSFSVVPINAFIPSFTSIDEAHKEHTTWRDSAKTIYKYSKPNTFIPKYKAYTSGIIRTDTSGRIYTFLYTEPDDEDITEQANNKKYTLKQAKDLYEKYRSNSKVKYTTSTTLFNRDDYWRLDDIRYYTESNRFVELLRTLFSRRKRLRLYCVLVFMIK